MKVIFIDDVPGVGRAGETKVVADGYGRNFLLPRRLAVLAESASANIVEAQLKKVAIRRAQMEAELAELGKQLEGQEITLKAKAGDKDRLYGSITSAAIAEELLRSTGITIDKRKIEIDEPIRELGSHEITIKLTGEVAPQIKLNVVREEEEEKPEEEEKAEEKPKKTARVSKKAAAKAEKTEEAAEVKEAAETAEATDTAEDKPEEDGG